MSASGTLKLLSVTTAFVFIISLPESLHIARNLASMLVHVFHNL